MEHCLVDTIRIFQAGLIFVGKTEWNIFTVATLRVLG